MSDGEAKLHEIRICTDPECGFRFPVSPTEARILTCPKCGAPTVLAEEPYRSFSIPEKAVHSVDSRVIAVLDNIRSTFNVGAMFRTADGCGITKLYLCGITPTPEHPKVGKTALGAETVVPWEHQWDTLEVVSSLKSRGYELWALEGGSTAREIFTEIKNASADKPIALIVGNEVSGVDPQVVNCCDHCIYIPMEGMKESLNVAIAFGIAAYLIRYREKLNE